MALGAAAAVSLTPSHSTLRPSSTSEPSTSTKRAGSPLNEEPLNNALLEDGDDDEVEPLEVRFAALFTGCTMAGLALAAVIQATVPLLGANSTQAYMALAAILQGATLPCLFVFTAFTSSAKRSDGPSTEET